MAGFAPEKLPSLPHPGEFARLRMADCYGAEVNDLPDHPVNPNRRSIKKAGESFVFAGQWDGPGARFGDIKL